MKRFRHRWPVPSLPRGFQPSPSLPGFFFTSKNPNMEVSVKELTAYGVRLYLKPLSRALPVVLQARLGSATGPVIAEQEVDEFTVDSSAATDVVVNDATDTANTFLTMKPWIPNLDVNCAMFAHYSTFAGGATAYSLNTSDFGALDVNGDPAVELGVDSETGETQAVIRVDLEIPPDEDTYCFSAVFDQHSKYGTVSGEVICNGTPCKWELTEAYWCRDEAPPVVKSVKATCVTGNNRTHTVISAEAGFAVVGAVSIVCTPGASYTFDVNKTAVKPAGTYNLKIESSTPGQPGTLFPVLIVLKVELANNVWWNGYDSDGTTRLDVTGHSVHSKLTATGVSVGNFEWSIVAGATKVELAGDETSTTYSSSITEINDNSIAVFAKAGSSPPGDDVTIQLKINGNPVCDFKMSVYMPTTLDLTSVVHSNHTKTVFGIPFLKGYDSYFHYTLKDQFGTAIAGAYKGHTISDGQKQVVGYRKVLRSWEGSGGGWGD